MKLSNNTVNGVKIYDGNGVKDKAKSLPNSSTSWKIQIKADYLLLNTKKTFNLL